MHAGERTLHIVYRCRQPVSAAHSSLCNIFFQHNAFLNLYLTATWMVEETHWGQWFGEWLSVNENLPTNHKFVVWQACIKLVPVPPQITFASVPTVVPLGRFSVGYWGSCKCCHIPQHWSIVQCASHSKGTWGMLKPPLERKVSFTAKQKKMCRELRTRSRKLHFCFAVKPAFLRASLTILPIPSVTNCTRTWDGHRRDRALGTKGGGNLMHVFWVHGRIPAC